MTFKVIALTSHVLFFTAALCAEQALAHGIGFERSNDPAEAVRFFYIGGDPMAYAAIKVFSPADGKAEYQEGFADAEGRFAFVPDVAGDWRVVASDGMGHRAEAVVLHTDANGEKSAAFSTSSDGRASADATGYRDHVPMGWKAALGLSLILNLALLAQWAVRRSRRSGEAARAYQ
ncbi:MAG: hypothetical protein FWC42_08515 [Proteobacteria bacterium]|nr:hypothetical protein [Pseudomonadota bacterium]